MFNNGGTRNSGLTFKSIWLFFVDNVVVILFATLIAVSLVYRISRFLVNRRNAQQRSLVRPINRKYGRHQHHHLRPCQIRTIRSSPDLNRSKFWPIMAAKQGPKIENNDSDLDNNSPDDTYDNYDNYDNCDNCDYHDYDYYRFQLIQKNLINQYGMNKVPGDLIFNSLHLSSIDSNTGIKLNQDYDHDFFDFIDNPLDDNKTNNNKTKKKFIHLRDYFLTKKKNNNNEKPESVDKATEATVSFVEMDQVPEMISFKERLKSPASVAATNVRKSQKAIKISKETTKFNKQTTNNVENKRKNDVEFNSRPTSPIKEFKKNLNDIKMPKMKQTSRKDRETALSTADKKLPPDGKAERLTILPSNNKTDRVAVSPPDGKVEPRNNRKLGVVKEIKSKSGVKLVNQDKLSIKNSSQDKMELKGVLSKPESGYYYQEKWMESENYNNNSGDFKKSEPRVQIMEIKNSDDKILKEDEPKNEKKNSATPLSLEKCSSAASSDVFNSSYSCSPRLPTGRRSRPTSACGASAKAFKHLMPKVNSRPRSSGGSFAWEVPDDSGKIWSIEKPTKEAATKAIVSPSLRPKSANPAVSRKKSDVPLSVLESIIDLTYDMTIDIQDSFATMGVDEIKERLEKSQLPLELKRAGDQPKYEVKNLRLNCGAAKKSKICRPMSSSRRRIKNTDAKAVESFDNQPIIAERKPFLQARSGNYSVIQMSAMRKNKNNY